VRRCLWVDLRADVGGYLGVGNRNSINQPTGLVAAAHVQHVVRHIGAGHVIGDHLHADGPVRAGVSSMSVRVMSVAGVAESVAEREIPFLDLDALHGRRKLERDVHKRVGARGYGQRLFNRGEAGAAILSR